MESAIRSLALACSTRATASAKSKFEVRTVSTIRFKAGSLNAFHHSDGAYSPDTASTENSSGNCATGPEAGGTSEGEQAATRQLAKIGNTAAGTVYPRGLMIAVRKSGIDCIGGARPFRLSETR